ncbi:MAG: winged helix-turn-helix domain-containing protein [Xanthomonadaceae bacterium]|nr:winged helix-turn-helix domain-containing protein [Xanthomonadaceae bacterium]
MTLNARTTWPWPEHTHRLVVGDLRIDLPNRRVERPDGVRQELPQRVFDLLLVFLAEPDTVHTRDTLFERVWQGVIVEDANLTQGVWMLRKAFGEERRQWFRTVSKTGYVFEPPTPVRSEDVDGMPSSPSAEASPASGEFAARGAVAHDRLASPLPRRGPRSRWVARLVAVAATLLAAFALLLPVLPLHGSRTVAAASSSHGAARSVAPPLRVYVSAEPPVVDPKQVDGLWAAALADAWLAYKIELLPQAQLMSPGTMPSGAPAGDERRVVFRASRDPRVADGIVLQAHITGLPDEAIRTIEVRGRASQVPTLAEDITQQVLGRLVRGLSESAWPPLPTDMRATRHYAVANQAERRREWETAEREANAASAIAPGFGPARWLQTRLRARKGDVRAAIELAAETRRTSTPLPDEAERILEAQILTLDPGRKEDAIARYEALTRAWPGRVDFGIVRAQLLVRVGRPADAFLAANASADVMRKQTLDWRIRHEIVSAEAAMLKGDPSTSRRHAQAALTLIPDNDIGLAREKGAARLLLARVHHSIPGVPAAPELFDLAAQAYDAAGDPPNALYARFMGDNVRLDTRPEASAYLEPLIEAARGMHNVSLEVGALRFTAYRFYHAGEHAKFREYLRRAQDTANRSDDLNSQRILDLDLMGEDFFMANFSSARARIRRLRAGGMDASIAFLVPLLDATMTFHQGRYRDAMKILRDGDAPGKQKPPSVVEANYACVRADIHLAMLDTVSARPQIDRCRNLGHPSLRAGARLLEVQADLVDGDRDSAQVKLRGIEKDIDQLATRVERWSLSGGAGYVIAAVGEYERAERLLVRELDATRDAGYLLMLAGIEISLAEVAAARGDWPRSRSLGLSARRRLPQDAWLHILRLDRLDIVDALVHGNLPAARARIASLRKRAEALDDRATLQDLRALTPLTSGESVRAGEGTVALDHSQAYIDWLYWRLPAQQAGNARNR